MQMAKRHLRTVDLATLPALPPLAKKNEEMSLAEKLVDLKKRLTLSAEDYEDEVYHIRGKAAYDKL